jgi:hypothetical protein
MLSVRPIVSTLTLALVLAAAGGAQAQATAPATPTVTPSPNCDKPGDAPTTSSSEIGKATNEQKRTKWNAGMKSYLDCLKKFVEEQQTASSAHARAANAAVEEYNKAIKIYNEQIQAQPQ